MIVFVKGILTDTVVYVIVYIVTVCHSYRSRIIVHCITRLSCSIVGTQLCKPVNVN